MTKGAETSLHHADDANDENLTYEAALRDLEAIISQMEQGSLSLKDTVSAYKRGAELLVICQNQLRDAEQKIQVFEAGVLTDYEARINESGHSK